MTPRTRNTQLTRRRLDAMRGLVGEFGVRQMDAADICDFLQFSPSGARKYIRDLREARVIEIARYIDGTEKYLGRPLYKLTADQVILAAFMAQLNSELPAAPRSHAPKQPKELGAGCRLHIMVDDKHYPVRVSRAPAVRDSLVTALFGPAVKA